MKKEMLVTDFDGVLQQFFEKKYGISIEYQQVPDGEFSLSISGEEIDEAVERLAKLSEFQARLKTPEMQRFMRGLVDEFRSEIRNPGGRWN